MSIHKDIFHLEQFMYSYTFWIVNEIFYISLALLTHSFFSLCVNAMHISPSFRRCRRRRRP